MSTLHQAGRVFQSALGLALSAALAVVAGSTSAGAAEQSGGERIGETSQAITLSYECSNTGGTTLGALNVTIFGGAVVNCVRTSAIMSGGQPPPPPPPGLISCWQLAKQWYCPGF